jgi:hypothetical protein
MEMELAAQAGADRFLKENTFAGGALPIPDETQDLPAARLRHDLKPVHKNIFVWMEMMTQLRYNVVQTEI